MMMMSSNQLGNINKFIVMIIFAATQAKAGFSSLKTIELTKKRMRRRRQREEERGARLPSVNQSLTHVDDGRRKYFDSSPSHDFSSL